MSLIQTNYQPSMSDYLNYIKTQNVREMIYKIELIRKSDQTPYESIEDSVLNSTGTINVTLGDGVRRTCSMTLKNIDNKYTSLFSNLSIGSKFKVSIGYNINGTPKYFPQGVFVFDSPSINSMLSEKTVDISGTDKWSMMDGTNGGIFEMTYIVESGDTIKNVIERTIVLDICNDLTPPIIDESIQNIEIPYDLEYSAGQSMSELMLEIGVIANAYIYYDENGALNIKPIEYDAEKGSTYDFVSGQDINYISATKQLLYTDVYNGVFVEADNSQDDVLPITAYVQNMDLTDPNSVPNLGHTKWYQVTDYTSGINTQQKADERVAYELAKKASLSSSLSINCSTIPHIVENTIITLTDEYVGSNQERFLVNSLSIPISYDGTMTIGCSKAMGYVYGI